MAEPAALPARAVAALACPVCGVGLSAVPAGLGCPAGHAFDRARQGYVHLAAGAIRHPGDSGAMVQARQRVLSAGLFEELTAALVAAVPHAAGVLLDLGAGTGHHLAAVLHARDASAATPPSHLADPAEMPAGSADQAGGGGTPAASAEQAGPVGIAVDTSKPALRRAARAHPRMLAIAADVTVRLPLQEGVIDAALITFAPRAAAELARVVAPGGTLVVAVPTPAHLDQLRAPLGMLDVPPGKDDQLVGALRGGFAPAHRRTVVTQATIDRATAADLALMGPAGFHTDAATLIARADGLPLRVQVTIAIEVHTFHRTDRPAG